MYPTSFALCQYYINRFRWSEISSRVMQSSMAPNYSEGIAKQFLESLERRREFQLDDSRTEDVYVDIICCIIDEEVGKIMKTISAEVLNKSLSLDEILRKSIANAIFESTAKESKRFLNLSGRIDVIHGALKDAGREETLSPSLTWTLPTVAIQSNPTSISKSSYCRVDLPAIRKSQEQIFKIDQNEDLHEDLNFESLKLKEREHVARISPSILSNARLNNNIRIGRVTCMRFLSPQYPQQRSLLVSGTSAGRLMVRSVDWTTIRPDQSIVSISPPGKKGSRGDIVDIRSSHFSSDTIVCLTSRGHVTVWSLHCISGLLKTTMWSSRKSSLSASTKSHSKVRVNNLIQLFELKSTDMNFSYNRGPNDPDDGPNLFDGFRKTRQVFALPLLCCFHPSVNILSNQKSFLLGFSNGDIVKCNMDNVVASADSPILYPDQPTVEKEYIHPNAAPKGFILTSGRMEKKGNKVFREIFHYHKTRIIFLDILSCQPGSVISIDANGKLAIWRYDNTFLCGKYWFRPQSSIDLDFNFCNYIPKGEPINKSPTDEESRELKLRIRKTITVDGEDIIREIYYPVHSEDDSGMLQYCCDISDSNHRTWTASSVSSETIKYELQSSKISTDTTEMVLHISCTQGEIEYNALVTILLDKMQFLFPIIRFECSPADGVVDYCAGPLNRETLSRFIFVLTKVSTIRVFSSRTGQELEIPFPQEKDFKPLTIAVCHSQRCVALSDPTRDYIVCFLLSHLFDGSQNDKVEIEEKLFPRDRDRSLIDCIAISTIHNSPSPPGSKSIYSNEVENIVSDIVGDIISRSVKYSERAFRAQMVNDVCEGFGLGVIQPTSWPPPELDEVELSKVDVLDEDIVISRTPSTPQLQSNEIIIALLVEIIQTIEYRCKDC